jgi:hypothetical protein
LGDGTRFILRCHIISSIKNEIARCCLERQWSIFFMFLPFHTFHMELRIS